ncbi:hypothetical protein J6590_033014 [Homalodisca vitripennis]|nr:hypothetical protein J6590_033014 [Homalodisca vitripennis]
MAHLKRNQCPPCNAPPHATPELTAPYNKSCDGFCGFVQIESPPLTPSQPYQSWEYTSPHHHNP